MMKSTKTKKPCKQRKRYYTAPLHIRNRHMTALLSHELREKYGVRRLPIHKDDKVVVFKAKSEDQEIKGKVIRVLPQRYAVHIEGHSKEKADGTIVSFPVHPSNIIITSLNLRDKKRRELIQRRSRTDVTEEVLTEDLFDEFEETAEESELESEEEFEEDVFDEFEDLDEEELDEEMDEEIPKEEIKTPQLDLSMIKGIGAKTAMLLKDNGFDTVEKIAKATPEELSKVPGIGAGTANSMTANAKDLLAQKADKKEES